MYMYIVVVVLKGAGGMFVHTMSDREGGINRDNIYVISITSSNKYVYKKNLKQAPDTVCIDVRF
jgi:hypothetical protein